MKTLTHSEQQPQGPKTHKKMPAIRLTIRRVFCTPKGSFFADTWSWMKSSARHTLSNKSVDNNQLKCCFDQQAQLKQLRLLI